MDHTYINVPLSEILSTINKASLFGGKISHPTSSNNEIFNINKIDIDSYGTIFITVNELCSLERKWPVSIMLNYRDISFQLEPDQYTIEGDVIIGQLPQKMRALPIRHDERYVLPILSQVQTSTYRIEKRGGNLNLSMKVIDFSKSGMAILMQNVTEEDILMRNDHLWIKDINGIPLDEPIFATIVYVSHRRYKDAVDLKAGISLQKEIPVAVLKKLQSMCSLILSA